MSLVHPPAWWYSGPNKARLAVVGQHHGEFEEMPFTSPQGQHFRRLLEDGGLPVVKLAFCHAGPAAPELIADAGAQWVLACGDEALHLWRPDLDVADVHGDLVLTDTDVAIVAVYHHDVFRRSPNHVALLFRELKTLQGLARARLEEGVSWAEQAQRVHRAMPLAPLA